MTTILHFEPVHIAIAVAVIGVILHNFRVYKAGKGINWKRKVDASLTMFVASVYASYEVFSSPGSLALNTAEQLALVLGHIGSIAGFGLLGEKVFNKSRVRLSRMTRTPEPVPVELAGDGWYKTNFTKGDGGNVLTYGNRYLYVEVPNARSYITAILRDASNNAIQIEQSDPGIKTVRLELFDRAGQLLTRGRYSLQIRADAGSGDAQGTTDSFEIV